MNFYEEVLKRGGNITLPGGEIYFAPPSLFVVFAHEQNDEKETDRLINLFIDCCDMDQMRSEIANGKASGDAFNVEKVITKLSDNERKELSTIVFREFKKVLNISQKYLVSFMDLIKIKDSDFLNLEDQEMNTFYEIWSKTNDLKVLSLIFSHLSGFIDIMYHCALINRLNNNTSDYQKAFTEALDNDNIEEALNQLGHIMKFVDDMSNFHNKRRDEDV